jgi:hypothetical protein
MVRHDCAGAPEPAPPRLSFSALQALASHHCSGLEMDKPINGFLKLFRVRFAGSDLGKPE